VRLGRLDHVGIAVTDLAAARDFYERTLGLRVAHEEVLADQGVHELLFRSGDAFVQLVAPLAPDTPVGRFLARRGEGVHHVGYLVPDVAAAVRELRAEGIEVIDPAPRTGSGGTVVAFVHPKSVRGVLVELVEEGTGHRGKERGGQEPVLPCPPRAVAPAGGSGASASRRVLDASICCHRGTGIKPR
jgi:methylmalonyl-CoA/ethylmalonyl-CoA epimerase